MKYIVSIIQPNRLDAVREALTALDLSGMTVTEAQGYGRQGGKSEIYRGAEYEVHFLSKLKIEIAVDDALATRAIEIISSAAQTGKIGDGKIFVFDLLEAVRVRTGEQGTDAL